MYPFFFRTMTWSPLVIFLLLGTRPKFLASLLVNLLGPFMLNLCFLDYCILRYASHLFMSIDRDH